MLGAAAADPGIGGGGNIGGSRLVFMFFEELD
jgi:hypothetical protein